MTEKMKITAGMGILDDYVSYVKAGADELFCGYVPSDWNRRYGSMTALNRREVLFYNIQIGTISDMEILASLVKRYGVPVAITFNSPYYLPEQYPIVAGYIRDLMALGFRDYIIADLGFMLYLKKDQGIASGIRIHVSGEFSEMSPAIMELLHENFGRMIRRIIFARKNTVPEMKTCIEAWNSKRDSDAECEFEAFIYNEKCHFSGGFCSSIHADELCHMCLMPYELRPQKMEMCDGGKVSFGEEMEMCDGGKVSFLEGDARGDSCGLCFLWGLKAAGITHLKVVGRGKCEEAMCEDIALVKRACEMLGDAVSEASFMDRIRNLLFEGKCSGDCYYENDVYWT